MFVRRKLYVSLLPCCTFVSIVNDFMVSLSVGMDPTSQPKKPLISTTYSRLLLLTRFAIAAQFFFIQLLYCTLRFLLYMCFKSRLILHNSFSFDASLNFVIINSIK